MVEHNKVDCDLQNTLEDAGIFYCFIDDFTTGNIGEIMTGTLRAEVKAYLAEHIDVNVTAMLSAASPTPAS